MNLISQRYPEPGDQVKVVQKEHYRTGQLTVGVVKDVLTKKRYHPRGHKVRLQDGTIGRIQSFIGDKKGQPKLTEKVPEARRVIFDPDELR